MSRQVQLTPEQRIKRELVTTVYLNCIASEDGASCCEVPVMETPEQIDEAWTSLESSEHADTLSDIAGDFRNGEFKTGLESPYSRHYEAEEVGAQLRDGTFVGWTYWYGGGKHGCPESVEWMSEAYELEQFSMQKMVTVHAYTRKDTGEKSTVTASVDN